MAKKIIGFILIAVSVFGAISNYKNPMESLPGAILLSVIGIYLFKSKTRKEKETERYRKEEAISYNQTHTTALHQTGLPLAQGAECEIGFEEDAFRFYGGGTDFYLAFEKITDICIKTETEIQKQYVSSIGGAVAGAVIFGQLGAIIGGRVKEKESTTISEYLIFTYIREGQIDYVSFELTNDIVKVGNWIFRFNYSYKTAVRNTISL